MTSSDTVCRNVSFGTMEKTPTIPDIIVEYKSPKILEPAVQVKNAFKKYGKDSLILNDFNMTVERGTIYGLLGASGCGKTTILSCIVGIRSLDSGNINVFGAQPGSKESGIPGKFLGYMPQDIGLYQVFTIEEILQYFGKIFGMSQAEVQSRIKFLVSFLDLPDSTRLISSLSGGQQRRTSLAVAMIHQPELLILDEPTVGVDPLIRESIWYHLCEIVEKLQTTVIITSHYIEECRNCNRIGLMRNGRLLTEKPPLTLLQEHNTLLLEDIVLKLCKNDNLHIATSDYLNKENQVTEVLPKISLNGSKKLQPVRGLSYKSRSPDDLTIRKPRNISKINPKKQGIAKAFGDEIYLNFTIIVALVIRNLLTLIRYPAFLFILISTPTVHIILINLVVGKNIKNLSLGVVNHEFESSIDYLQTICNNVSNECFGDELSCNFLNAFPQDEIKWISFSSEGDALKSVQSGDTFGYASIPANFSENLKDRFISRNFVTNETMNGSEIAFRIDMSANVQANFIRSGIYEYYLEFIKNIVSDCEENSRSVESPLIFNPVYGNLKQTYLTFIIPSQVLLIILMIPMLSGLIIIWDKKAGTLDRNLVAGVKIAHVFLSFIISDGLIIIAFTSLFYLVLLFVFDYQIQGSFLLSFLLCFMQGISGLSIGFVFGTYFNQELEMIFAILAVHMTTGVLSGGYWPTSALPEWARRFCDLLPATLSTEALRSINNRGWGLENAHVWHGFVALTCWTLFCYISSGILHRIRK